MADDFRDELISISEKLGKYNSAMQESLNILSDEFLLLRDELSTLNQSLEKAKTLDEKMDEFGKTVAVLEKMKDTFSTLEKVSNSLEVASGLGGKLDELIKLQQAGGESSQALGPLNEKIDKLYAKFDESLSPLGKKIDAVSLASTGGISEGLSLLSKKMEFLAESQRKGLQEGIAPLGKKIDGLTDHLKEAKPPEDAQKSDEQLKSLAITIQDELSKLHQSVSEQAIAVKSVGTSLAYLSETEVDIKKSFEGFAKQYEQERQKALLEKGKADPEGKKKDADALQKRLEEIASVLKMQTDSVQRQEALLEGMKKSIAGANGAENSAELNKHTLKLAEIQKQIKEQSEALSSLRSAMPTGSFEEVIKHADLMNQTIGQKLDAVAEGGVGTAKTLQSFGEKMAQLPSLMQSISTALDMLVHEMRKSQADYKSLQNAVQSAAAKPAGPDHLDRLESISDNLKGLHTKIDTQKPTSPSPLYEQKLSEVITELQKFEEIEKQRMLQQTITQTPADSSIAPRFDALSEQLKRMESLISQLGQGKGGDKAPSAIDAASPRMDALTEQLRKIEALISQQKSTGATSQNAEMVAPKIDAIAEQLRKLENIFSSQAAKSNAAAPGSAISEDGIARLETQMISMKKDFGAVSLNVAGLKESLQKGVEVSADVDFAPLIRKIGELESKVDSAFRQPERIEAPAASAPLPTERLMDQRQVLEEIQQNIHIFETFELSDRANIVVDRLSMLVKRAIAMYSM